MAIGFGNLTTQKNSSSQTSATYTHICAANTSLLVVRVALRGISATPTAVSVSINGSAASLVTGSLVTNSNSRALTAFYILPNPPAGSLSVSLAWNNTANEISSALDLTGAASQDLTSQTGLGNSASVVLSIACPQDGLVLDSIDANNDRTFSPTDGVIPHYTSLGTATGSSDVSHCAGYRGGTGTLSLGWTISSASNYVYSLIAIPAAAEPPPAGGGGQFLYFFGDR